MERNQQNNSDFIYEAVDEMPIFPGWTSKFNEFIKNNREDSLLLNGNKPHRVTLEVVIEKTDVFHMRKL